jgi:hypothetical protein
MRQPEKLVTLAIIGSATLVTVVGIFSFTATRFTGSGNSLYLDVEVKPNTMKVRTSVNGDEVVSGQREKGVSPKLTTERQ